MALTDWLPIFPTWLYVIVSVAVCIYIYGVWPYKTNRLPYPGPPPTAFIGNIKEILSEGISEVDVKNVKKYGNVHIAWLARVPSLVVADTEMLKEITVKQFPNFMNRPLGIAMGKIMKDQLTVIQDEHWKFVRGILSPAFSSGKLREMVSLVQMNTDNLVDVMEERAKEAKSFEMKTIFDAFTLDVISATAFGMDTCVQKNPDDAFAEQLKQMFKNRVPILMVLNLIFPFLKVIMDKFEITSMTKEMVAGMDAIVKTVKEVIELREHDKEKRRDLLQLMLDARIDTLEELRGSEDVDVDLLKSNIQKMRKGLTEDEVMAQSFVFLLAGYATTSSTLSFLAYHLAINPECQEKLIDEVDFKLQKEKPTYDNVMQLPYLEMCLSETLRHFPPAVRITRECKEAVTIKGHYIPKGMGIQIPVCYLHRNPEYWPEPEKFIPERFTPENKAKRDPYVYMPFGSGPRNCVGMRLAQLESKMAIVAILQKYRFVRSVDTEVPLKIKKTGLVEAENGIWIKDKSKL